MLLDCSFLLLLNCSKITCGDHSYRASDLLFEGGMNSTTDYMKNPSSVWVFCAAGHLSYRQMESVREVLLRVGTWDLLQMHCGEQLKGDYRSCQYIALNRQETSALEFSRVKTLSADSLWALLGHTPQVSPPPCRMHLGLNAVSVGLNNQMWHKTQHEPAGGSSTLRLSHSGISFDAFRFRRTRFLL